MTQTANLTRVKTSIGHHVAAFFANRHHGDEFHVEELTDYVKRQASTAPGSPDRTMRQMRLAGELDYEVVSRSRSLYRVVRREIQQELF